MEECFSRFLNCKNSTNRAKHHIKKLDITRIRIKTSEVQLSNIATAKEFLTLLQ